MRKKCKTLILPAILAAAVLAGAQTALAQEQDSYGQTESGQEQDSYGQTESTQGQDSYGQTESTQGQDDSYGQTESEQEQDSYGTQEPSDKRGLQSEDGSLFFYDSDGLRATGWMKIKKKIYYFRAGTSNKLYGSAFTGLKTIGDESYYFNEKGVLQTGWQTINGKRYYFATTGALGKIGKMYTELKKIDGKRYYFDMRGRMQTGWVQYGDNLYYFTKKKESENYGAAYTGWNTISKEQYYFSAKGALKTNCWISKKYYVDEEGRLLKNCVTPDGYIVDSKGQRGKLANGFVKIGDKIYCFASGKKLTGLKKINGKLYYFSKKGVRKESGWFTKSGGKYYVENGVVQTGWVTCEGKRYYFSEDGKMAAGKTVDGIQIGKDGVVPFSVLLLSGHGQGDSGATATYGSTSYREDKLTREFSTLVYNQLKSISPGISVTMYDQNYDCYQVLSGKKSGPKPNFKLFDYVLEIHFNATGYASKDIGGDGNCKGIGMYVNVAKRNTTIDKKIVAAVSNAVGLPIWGRGTGIFTSSGLFNAKTLQSMGVSYGLLETAFIDDRDDMRIYNSKKTDMAKAVATAIKEYFGV